MISFFCMFFLQLLFACIFTIHFLNYILHLSRFQASKIHPRGDDTSFIYLAVGFFLPFFLHVFLPLRLVCFYRSTCLSFCLSIFRVYPQIIAYTFHRYYRRYSRFFSNRRCILGVRPHAFQIEDVAECKSSSSDQKSNNNHCHFL